MTNEISKITDIVECYLLDMDGTVYLSGKAIEGAAEAIERLRKKSKVLFVTNNTSKARTDYCSKLSSMKIPATKDDIYTAGNATIDYLKLNYKNKKIHLLGTQNLIDEFKSYQIELEDKSPDLVVIGFDTTLTYAKLSLTCDFIRSGVPFIATHPDLNCPVENGYIPDVGSFLALIKASTNCSPLEICGKPFGAIASGVAARVGVKKENIAMVGDRLSTDMKFGIANGFKTILVLSGEATKKDLDECGLKVDLVINSIAEL